MLIKVKLLNRSPLDPRNKELMVKANETRYIFVPHEMVAIIQPIDDGKFSFLHTGGMVVECDGDVGTFTADYQAACKGIDPLQPKMH